MKKIVRLLKKVFHIPSNMSQSQSIVLESLIMVRGNQHLLLQQHYHIITFSHTEIKLQTNNKIIHIKGLNLHIKTMYPQEIALEGDIEEIKFL